MHIIQKGEVGIKLVQMMENCIRTHDTIFLSNKEIKNGSRYMFMKHVNLGIVGNRNMVSKDIVVVVECLTEKNHNFVITAMVADKKYISRKYKKLRYTMRGGRTAPLHNHILLSYAGSRADFLLFCPT